MRRAVFSKAAVLFAAGAFLVLPSPPASAGGQRLALSQVVEYSLRNNGGLNSFRKEKGIREAGRVKAGLLPNPVLELAGGSGAPSASEDNDVSLGVSQEFLLGGKREKRLAVAERELELYQWQLADRERVLRGEVETAFYDALLAAERKTLADRAVQLNLQLLDVTSERLAAGDIPELDRDLVKVEVARSEGARIGAESALRQGEARLAALMGLPPEATPSAAGNLEEDIAAMTVTPADLKELALANRPDLKALEAERGRGDADVNLARAEAVPNLTAGLSVQRETISVDFAGSEAKDTAFIVGAKLSMPIPVFDRNQAGVQEALARRSGAESRVAVARLAIEREVETAYDGLVSADRVVTLYRTKIIPQVEENLKVTLEAYRIGETGILAVIQEQKRFIEVKESYLSALHDRAVSLGKLRNMVASDLSGGVR